MVAKECCQRSERPDSRGSVLGRMPADPVTRRTTRSFGRRVILAAAGLLGALLGREKLVGRQRALD